MFFYLSKLLHFILSPLTWVAALLLFAIFTKNVKNKRRFLITTILTLLLFSNSGIFNTISYQYETPAVSINKLKDTYDIGIVLGGMVRTDPTLNRAQFTRSSDRLIQTIYLFKKGIIKKILFTGGSGSILHQEFKEAQIVKDYIISFGVPDSCLILESESRNTRENALFSKPLLQKNAPKGKYLLITSSYHLPRAKACFEKTGIHCTVFSTDRMAGPFKFEFDHWFIPSLDALNGWEALLHEWSGYLLYKIAGYV